MQLHTKCRFAIHLGIGSISYVKIARNGDSWRVVSCGELPWHSLERTPDASKARLDVLLKRLCTAHAISRESIHVSLHSRYCVSRVVTGESEQVAMQLDEIIANSHHYLQFGLGEKLIGRSSTHINTIQQYAQVAIIKRGLIEAVEKAIRSCGLKLQSIDGAMPSLSRLVGYTRLDSEQPVLIVWMADGNAEIGISYQGRLQLTYHLSGCCTVEDVAETMTKHMKRLQRFCGRYRSVEGNGQLRKALVFANQQQAMQLRDCLGGAAFEHICTAQDLALAKTQAELETALECSPGVYSALGGLLVHLEKETLPTTDILENYLAAKPRKLLDIVLRDGWMVMAAAAVLLLVSGAATWLDSKIQTLQDQSQLASSGLVSEREQLLALDAARGLLKEYQRVAESASQITELELIHLVASCLPEDTRVDSIAIDSQHHMILKGVMIQGDKTYEVLKSLRNSALVAEVALESVGKASSYGPNATLFEIHCQLAEFGQVTSKRLAVGKAWKGYQ